MSTASITNHTTTISVGGKEIGGWSSYSISQSMLRPADSFSMERPFDRDAWALCKPDAPVSVQIDGVTVLTGFVDDREKPEDADTIMITGRDKVGRLVQESSPKISYKGMTESRLIAAVAAPWFTSVVMTNARNRKIVRGRGSKAPAGNEPIRIDNKSGTDIEPGQMRWTVIEELLKQSGNLCWSSGDGKELIIGRPNYVQNIQWKIFHPAERTRRGSEGTALGLAVKDSVGDRYSRIVVVGSGSGTTANYGAAPSARYGQAKDNDATENGEGGDFSQQKVLMMVEDVQSQREAREIAEREMARRKAAATRISVRMPLHGQRHAGQRLTLFALDTQATVEDEVTGTYGTYLVTGLKFQSSRDSGETTTLEMTPKGTELFL